MIPVVVFWTKYTATVGGRVLKLVPCENCSTEYVYVLEREGAGVGTSVYALNNEGARDNAASAAEESLREYLANDFDPVPCPACGHYQRYMFPKLLEERSTWGPVTRLATLAVGVLAAVTGVYWTFAYLGRPSNFALWRMAAAWSAMAAAGLLAAGLSVSRRAWECRFDPNVEDQQVRIEKGRRRAVTRAEFEASRRQGPS